MGCQCTRNKLTPENLLEFGLGKDQLEWDVDKFCQT